MMNKIVFLGTITLNILHEAYPSRIHKNRMMIFSSF
ncbi:unnamed protein product [Larinioides sclopetarius]|uniref:Uncharacterized protein n=1 Tax=Larinioides sclopetarius TaxID=280406 RepID=A0AAV1ZRS1_9ARAC